MGTIRSFAFGALQTLASIEQDLLRSLAIVGDPFQREPDC